MPPGLRIDPGAKEWPDFMGCGNPLPSFFVSDIVIDDLEANGVPVWRKTHAPIAEVGSKTLREKPAPKYYVVEVEPGIDVDFEASGVAVGSDGKPQLTKDQRAKQPVMRLDYSSWTGADLFCYSNWRGGSRLDLLCTDKVKALAEKEGWTNVRFEKQFVAGADPWTGKLVP